MKPVYKIFFSIILSFTLIAHAAAISYAKEQEQDLDPNKLYARSAVLMDADSGRILYEKDAHTKMPMASTTKIMTCIVALESGKAEEVTEISSYAASMPKVHLGMKAGEHYRVKDLLYSLMLESHNDSAVAIAECVGGSVEGFADMMNSKAEELGCLDTYFITPNGLDAKKEVMSEDGEKVIREHSTTASDLAAIMSYCITDSPQKEEFLEITRTPSYQFSNVQADENGEAVPGGRNFSCDNHNAFLSMMDGALTGKTGFTGKAGYCYVGALERDGKTFVVSLLACGWPNNKTYKWQDTRKLMEYGIANYEKRDFSEIPIEDGWLSPIAVEDAATPELFQEAKVEVAISDRKDAPCFLMRKEEQVEVSCQVKKRLKAPVLKGDVVGKITYKMGDEICWERKIVTTAQWEKIGFAWYFSHVILGYFR